MCPACIATAAWIAAGAGSAGGLTAFVFTRRRSRKEAKNSEPSRVSVQSASDQARTSQPSSGT